MRTQNRLTTFGAKRYAFVYGNKQCQSSIRRRSCQVTVSAFFITMNLNSQLVSLGDLTDTKTPKTFGLDCMPNPGNAAVRPGLQTSPNARESTQVGSEAETNQAKWHCIATRRLAGFHIQFQCFRAVPLKHKRSNGKGGYFDQVSTAC